MKRVLFCSLFWMFFSQFVCFRLMGRSMGHDDAFFTVIYAAGTLFPVVMLLSRAQLLPLPLLLVISGLMASFCVVWVWYAATYIFF